MRDVSLCLLSCKVRLSPVEGTPQTRLTTGPHRVTLEERPEPHSVSGPFDTTLPQLLSSIEEEGNSCSLPGERGWTR